jgi:ABC-type transport system substrate-binding protein
MCCDQVIDSRRELNLRQVAAAREHDETSMRQGGSEQFGILRGWRDAVFLPKNRSRTGSGSGPVLDLFFGCGSRLNWDGYCNPEVDRAIEQQSMEGDQDRRKQLLWAIERKLADDVARPIIFYNRGGNWQPYVKGLTLMVNSLPNGWRMEDVWLDK